MRRAVSKRTIASREDASAREPAFAEVLNLIQSARKSALQSV
jgi:hypothetical protein